MTSMTFFFVFVPILAIILLAVNLIFAPHSPYQEKDSAFECGFHSFLGQNRTQFSISFFIFALLFLLFDLEILLVYPYVVSAYSNGIYGLVIMLIFFLALTLGFAFELGKNALKIDSRQTVTLISKQNSLTTLISKFSAIELFVNVFNKIIYFVVKSYLVFTRGGLRFFFLRFSITFLCSSLIVVIFYFCFNNIPTSTVEVVENVKENIDTSNTMEPNVDIVKDVKIKDLLKFRLEVLRNPTEILCWIYLAVSSVCLTIIGIVLELFRPQPNFDFNSNTTNLFNSNINLSEPENFNLSGQDLTTFIYNFVNIAIPMAGHWEGIDLNHGSNTDFTDKVSPIVSKNANTEDLGVILADSSFTRGGNNLIREPVKDTSKSLITKDTSKSLITKDTSKSLIFKDKSIEDLIKTSLSDNNLDKHSYLNNIHTNTDNNLTVNMATARSLEHLTAFIYIQDFRPDFMRYDPLFEPLYTVRRAVRAGFNNLIGSFMSWQEHHWDHFRDTAGLMLGRINTEIAFINRYPGTRSDQALAELRGLHDILTNIRRPRVGTFLENRDATLAESRFFYNYVDSDVNRFTFLEIPGYSQAIRPLINNVITVLEGELSVLNEPMISVDNLIRGLNVTTVTRDVIRRVVTYQEAIFGFRHPRVLYLRSVISHLEGQIVSYGVAINHTRAWGNTHASTHGFSMECIINNHRSSITTLNNFRAFP